MRISVRLLILLVVAALPIFALQVHGLLEGREERKAKIAQRALDLARLAAAQQDQFIEGARHLLAAAAQFPEVQNLDAAGCDSRITDLLKHFPIITGMGAVAPDGVRFCTGGRGEAEASIADQAYFQEAVRRRSLAISGLILGGRSGVPRIDFAYPALGGAREVRAVVVLAYSLERLSESLSATPLPAGATISLVDGSGILLARAPPAPESIGQVVRESAFTRTMLDRRQGVLESVGIDGMERLHGFAPLLTSADLFAVVGLPWRAAFHEADRMFWRDVIVTAVSFVLAALVALLIGEHWISRPVATLEQVVDRMESGDLSARARLGRRGSPELHRLAASFNDMASSLQARQAALQASEARLRAVVDTAADGIITINRQGMIESVNPEVERLLGYGRDELIGQNVRMLMPSPDYERHDEYLARYLRTGEAQIIGIGREVTGRHKDGSRLPLFLSIGEFSLEGERFFTGIVRDITERKRFEERQRLLVAEIDHRAKNLLATIQAMALLTGSDTGSVRDYAETLIGRLQAMARAHDLLARDKWQGARLHDLIEGEFAAYVGADADALALSGDDLLLSPRAAQTLSLVFHELTTNAAKYGALSVPHGRVTIRSSIERAPTGDSLLLTWTESGGPEVAAPERSGFGTVVIQRSIGHDLDGSATIEFERDGLRCDIRVPLS
jgi:PAS domain S-box-containing protein